MIIEQTKYLKTWKRISTMLLVAFMLQVANTALFYHTHKTIDGVTYAHSHPNNGKHTHDFNKCYLFDHFDTIALTPTEYLLKDSPYQFEFEYKTSSPLWIKSIIPNDVNGRAPPVA